MPQQKCRDWGFSEKIILRINEDVGFLQCPQVVAKFSVTVGAADSTLVCSVKGAVLVQDKLIAVKNP